MHCFWHISKLSNIVLTPSGASTWSLVAGRWSLVAGRWSLVAGLSLIWALSNTSSGFAQSITAAVFQSGTNVTRQADNSPFGNSIEAGGTYQLDVAGGAAATFVTIETELFKKNGNNWVKQGDTKTADVMGNSWSNLRIKNLADGEYKVTTTFKYNQTNPAVPTNPRDVSDTKTFTFITPPAPKPKGE